MKQKILVVDDQEQLRDLIRMMLEHGGYEVLEALDSVSLNKSLAGPEPDIVLLDLHLPDANGIDLLPQIKRTWPDTEVIVLTGHATYETAVEAIKRGAFHFQQKPVDNTGLLNLIEKALERRRLNSEALSLRSALTTMSGGAAPVFQCAVMKNVLKAVERVAPSDVSVLITGESGTGKEVVSDLIHNLSNRSKGQFVKVNCAALPRDLIESELFGSVKGAFTGATEDRKGLFRQAEGGTLLLDELSEMPIDTQSKLLRVLQEKEVRPVGGKTSYKIDCRIIAATNRKVEDAIRDGKLREDLYYRISAFAVHLPSLRERREDILALAGAFLKRFAAQSGRPISGYTPAAQERLRKYDWPGNVRQLQNEVQRAVLMCETSLIEAHDLSITEALANGTADLGNLTLMEAVEKNKIIEVLRETHCNKVETARRLGIGRQTLYNKIKAYDIHVDELLRAA